MKIIGITIIAALLFSCAESFEQEEFICENAAAEYIPARAEYMQAVQEYEDLVSSGTLTPEIVQGTDLSRIRFMLDDPRVQAFNAIFEKWQFCPYLDKPERMEEYLR